MPVRRIMEIEEAGPSAAKSEPDEFIYQMESSELNIEDIDLMYKSEVEDQSDHDDNTSSSSWNEDIEDSEIDENDKRPIKRILTNKLEIATKLSKAEFADIKRAWVAEPVSMSKIPFTEQPGLRVLPPYDARPIDYFYMLADDSFFELICTEINIRAVELFLEKAESRMSSWRDVTKTEMETFFGLLFHMGAIQSLRIEDYWKTHRLFGIPCFHKYMKRNRFLLILKCFQFQHRPAEEDPIPDDHLDKVTPIVNFFNEKMRTIYTPHKHLYLDEPMVFYRGRLLLQRCIKKEKHNYGIKTLYTLIDSTGLIINFALSTVFATGLGGTFNPSRIVLKLMKKKLNLGYSLHMDKFYSSFRLAKQLLNLNTYCTGMLHPGRRTIPEEVANAKLNAGETVCRYAEGVCIGKFNDKRDFMYLSTEHDNALVEDTNYSRDSKHKPKPIVEFNKYIPSTDLQEQMMSYYPFARKTVAWHKKLGFHIIHMMIFNAYLLHNKYSGKKLPFYEFRFSIIEALLPPDPNAPTGKKKKKSLNQTLLEHFPSKCVKNGQGRAMRRKCKVCWNNHIRRDTQYLCVTCEGSPGLCLEPCFKEFHRDIN